MNVLVIAEHDNQSLKSATLHTLAAAKQLTDDIDVLVMGANQQAVVESIAKIASVKTVLSADNLAYEHQLAENCAPLIAKLAEGYDALFCGATTFGKNVLPRAAALLDMGMLSDVTRIIDEKTFERPIYAGNVIATVQTNDKIKIATIRTTAFKALELAELSSSDDASAKIKTISDVIPNTQSRFESQQLTQSARPELTSAKIVVSGGRGLKSAENFALLEKLADTLGAAIGASRAAVDAGFAPNDYQVGQTGKVVAPDLYIAVGISGAIQHLAGMKDSKVIVAINNDPEAPIMQVADYVLVGDLFKLIPELQAAIAKEAA